MIAPPEDGPGRIRVLRVEHTEFRCGPYNAYQFFWPDWWSWERPWYRYYGTQNLVRVIDMLVSPVSAATDVNAEWNRLGCRRPAPWVARPTAPPLGTQRWCRFGFLREEHYINWFGNTEAVQALTDLGFVLATYSVYSWCVRSTARQAVFRPEVAIRVAQTQLHH